MRAAATLLFLTIVTTPVRADSLSELAQARHDLYISEQVLARVSARVDAARSDPATAPQERQRLDDYLVRVRDLMALNRERVLSLEQAAAALPAGPPAGATGGVAGAPAATNAEEISALDAKLGGSLAEFDQLLLEEARKARSRAPTRASAAGAAAGTAGEANGRSTQASARGGAAASGKQQPDPASSGTGPGSPGGRIQGTEPGVAGATAAVPPDVGDGSDDDIVARQIRRAAEAETDPELRKKLWDEYRKYKGGTQG